MHALGNWKWLWWWCGDNNDNKNVVHGKDDVSYKKIITN